MGKTLWETQRNVSVLIASLSPRNDASSLCARTRRRSRMWSVCYYTK